MVKSFPSLRFLFFVASSKFGIVSAEQSRKNFREISEREVHDHGSGPHYTPRHGYHTSGGSGGYHSSSRYNYPYPFPPTERPTPLPTPNPTPDPTPLPTLKPTPSPSSFPSEAPLQRQNVTIGELRQQNMI